jgi:hypothetical protein
MRYASDAGMAVVLFVVLCPFIFHRTVQYTPVVPCHSLPRQVAARLAVLYPGSQGRLTPDCVYRTAVLS